MTNQFVKWMTFSGLILMVVMANIDATIVNLALPDIGSYLNIPLASMQWVINMYLLVTMATFVLGGKLGDVYGRRKVYLIGIIVFIIGSTLAGLASNQWHMYLGRGIQGLGFAMTFTTVIILITSMFSESRRGAIMGITLVFSGIAQAIGPSVGGVILHYLDWRWIFFINIPLGLLSFAITWFFCPKGLVERKAEKIDYLGAALLAISSGLVVTGLNEINHWGLKNIDLYFVFIGGLVFMGFFIWHSLRKKEPLIQLHFFSNQRYVAVNIVRAIFMYNYVMLLFILPIYLQNILNYNALHASYFLLAMTLVFGVSSPFIGRWLDTVSPRFSISLSVILLIFSLLCFGLSPYILTTETLILGLLLTGISVAMNINATITAAMAEIPQEQQGVGMGLFYTLTFFGGSVGIALSGSIVGLISRVHIISHTASTTLANYIAQLQLAASGARSITDLQQELPANLFQQALPLVRQSFSIAFTTVMGLSLLLTLVSLYYCRRLPNNSTKGIEAR